MAEQQQAKFEWSRYVLPYLAFIVISGFFWWSVIRFFSNNSGCSAQDTFVLPLLFIAYILAPVPFLYYKKAPAKWYMLISIQMAFLLLMYVLSTTFFGVAKSDCTITWSNSYWRNEARPFAIMEHQAYLKDSSITITIQNYGTQSITIQKIRVGNSTKLLGFTFEPEQERDITMKHGASNSAHPGEVYWLNVTITYLTPDGQERVFVGAKPIVGKYL